MGSYLLPSLVDSNVLISGDVNAEVPLVRVLVLRPRDMGGDAGDAEGEGDEEDCSSLCLMGQNIAGMKHHLSHSTKIEIPRPRLI